MRKTFENSEENKIKNEELTNNNQITFNDKSKEIKSALKRIKTETLLKKVQFNDSNLNTIEIHDNKEHEKKEEITSVKTMHGILNKRLAISHRKSSFSNTENFIQIQLIQNNIKTQDLIKNHQVPMIDKKQLSQIFCEGRKNKKLSVDLNKKLSIISNELSEEEEITVSDSINSDDLKKKETSVLNIKNKKSKLNKLLLKKKTEAFIKNQTSEFNKTHKLSNLSEEKIENEIDNDNNNEINTQKNMFDIKLASRSHKNSINMNNNFYKKQGLLKKVYSKLLDKKIKSHACSPRKQSQSNSIDNFQSYSETENNNNYLKKATTTDFKKVSTSPILESQIDSDKLENEVYRIFDKVYNNIDLDTNNELDDYDLDCNYDLGFGINNIEMIEDEEKSYSKVKNSLQEFKQKVVSASFVFPNLFDFEGLASKIELLDSFVLNTFNKLDKNNNAVHKFDSENGKIDLICSLENLGNDNEHLLTGSLSSGREFDNQKPQETIPMDVQNPIQIQETYRTISSNYYYQNLTSPSNSIVKKINIVQLEPIKIINNNNNLVQNDIKINEEINSHIDCNTNRTDKKEKSKYRVNKSENISNNYLIFKNSLLEHEESDLYKEYLLKKSIEDHKYRINSINCAFNSFSGSLLGLMGLLNQLDQYEPPKLVKLEILNLTFSIILTKIVNIKIQQTSLDSFLCKRKFIGMFVVILQESFSFIKIEKINKLFEIDPQIEFENLKFENVIPEVIEEVQEINDIEDDTNLKQVQVHFIEFEIKNKKEKNKSIDMTVRKTSKNTSKLASNKQSFKSLKNNKQNLPNINDYNLYNLMRWRIDHIHFTEKALYKSNFTKNQANNSMDYFFWEYDHSKEIEFNGPPLEKLYVRRENLINEINNDEIKQELKENEAVQEPVFEICKLEISLEKKENLNKVEKVKVKGELEKKKELKQKSKFEIVNNDEATGAYIPVKHFAIEDKKPLKEPKEEVLIIENPNDFNYLHIITEEFDDIIPTFGNQEKPLHDNKNILKEISNQIEFAINNNNNINNKSCSSSATINTNETPKISIVSQSRLGSKIINNYEIKNNITISNYVTEGRTNDFTIDKNAKRKIEKLLKISEISFSLLNTKINIIDNNIELQYELKKTIEREIEKLIINEVNLNLNDPIQKEKIKQMILLKLNNNYNSFFYKNYIEKIIELKLNKTSSRSFIDLKKIKRANLIPASYDFNIKTDIKKEETITPIITQPIHIKTKSNLVLSSKPAKKENKSPKILKVELPPFVATETKKVNPFSFSKKRFLSKSIISLNLNSLTTEESKEEKFELENLDNNLDLCTDEGQSDLRVKKYKCKAYNFVNNKNDLFKIHNKSKSIIVNNDNLIKYNPVEEDDHKPLITFSENVNFNFDDKHKFIQIGDLPSSKYYNNQDYECFDISPINKYVKGIRKDEDNNLQLEKTLRSNSDNSKTSKGSKLKMREYGKKKRFELEGGSIDFYNTVYKKEKEINISSISNIENKEDKKHILGFDLFNIFSSKNNDMLNTISTGKNKSISLNPTTTSTKKNIKNLVFKTITEKSNNSINKSENSFSQEKKSISRDINLKSPRKINVSYSVNPQQQNSIKFDDMFLNSSRNFNNELNINKFSSNMKMLKSNRSKNYNIISFNFEKSDLDVYQINTNRETN